MWWQIFIKPTALLTLNENELKFFASIIPLHTFHQSLNCPKRYCFHHHMLWLSLKYSYSIGLRSVHKISILEFGRLGRRCRSLIRTNIENWMSQSPCTPRSCPPVQRSWVRFRRGSHWPCRSILARLGLDARRTHGKCLKIHRRRTLCCSQLTCALSA